MHRNSSPVRSRRIRAQHRNSRTPTVASSRPTRQLQTIDRRPSESEARQPEPNHQDLDNARSRRDGRRRDANARGASPPRRRLSHARTVHAADKATSQSGRVRYAREVRSMEGGRRPVGLLVYG